ncbi:SDR family oxidoreductase [Streptomyces sp. NPDC004009]
MLVVRSDGRVLSGTDALMSAVPRVPESGRDAMRSKIPFMRFGTSQEVAEAVAFLASDAAGHITGQDITAAGGYGLGA